MKKIKLFFLFNLFLSLSFSQKATNLQINFPEGLDYSQIFITVNNGITNKKIHLDTQSNKVYIKDFFYSKYAAVQVYFKRPNFSNAYYSKSFFVTDKPACIIFKYTNNKEDLLDNYLTDNCIDFSSAGEAEMNNYTLESADAINEFLKKHGIVDLNDSLTKIYDSLNIIYANKQLEFIQKNSSIYYSLWIFKTECSVNTYLEPTRILSFFQTNFPDSFKQSEEGIAIMNTINGRLLAKDKVAPDFEAYDISNKLVSLKNYKNKMVLLQFWASWCGPCLAELKYIRKIRSLYDTSKLVVISITSDNNYSDFIKAVKKNKMKWIQIFNGHSIINKYNVGPIPRIFLIDQNGKIAYINQEEQDPELQHLIQLLKIKQIP